MNNVLNLKIGSKFQNAIVKDMYQTNAPDKDGNMLPKIYLEVSDAMHNNFRIDEAWVLDRDGTVNPKGMWLKLDTNGNLNSVCTAAQVMNYYGVKTLGELIGLAVTLYPKPNGFLAIVATDVIV